METPLIDGNEQDDGVNQQVVAPLNNGNGNEQDEAVVPRQQQEMQEQQGAR